LLSIWLLPGVDLAVWLAVGLVGYCKVMQGPHRDRHTPLPLALAGMPCRETTLSSERSPQQAAEQGTQAAQIGTTMAVLVAVVTDMCRERGVLGREMRVGNLFRVALAVVVVLALLD
jgi:hypothetical protein